MASSTRALRFCTPAAAAPAPRGLLPFLMPGRGRARRRGRRRRTRKPRESRGGASGSSRDCLFFLLMPLCYNFRNAPLFKGDKSRQASVLVVVFWGQRSRYPGVQHFADQVHFGANLQRPGDGRYKIRIFLGLFVSLSRRLGDEAGGSDDGDRQVFGPGLFYSYLFVTDGGQQQRIR